MTHVNMQRSHVPLDQQCGVPSFYHQTTMNPPLSTKTHIPKLMHASMCSQCLTYVEDLFSCVIIAPRVLLHSENMYFWMFGGNFMLQERKGRVTHVARHWHECELASLKLIMVIYDAICFASFLGCVFC